MTLVWYGRHIKVDNPKILLCITEETLDLQCTTRQKHSGDLKMAKANPFKMPFRAAWNPESTLKCNSFDIPGYRSPS
ncbi:hypothetical protein CEXT_159741 [Caerostris extrusa]|uniref:Uncharacterized protein n=1 Tax=Caerostris extrusa TaxID=172846 RepID=A0AAV4SPW4_CAEEX|nr:hypothetical protein CEXT_159741 [Caerostris extrusa]